MFYRDLLDRRQLSLELERVPSIYSFENNLVVFAPKARSNTSHRFAPFARWNTN